MADNGPAAISETDPSIAANYDTPPSPDTIHPAMPAPTPPTVPSLEVAGATASPMAAPSPALAVVAETAIAPTIQPVAAASANTASPQDNTGSRGVHPAAAGGSSGR